MKYFPRHETRGDACVPMSPWQSMSSPTCNNLHEMGLVSSLEDTSLRLLSSSGSWRDAWRFKAWVPFNQKQILDNVIIKTIKFEQNGLPTRMKAGWISIFHSVPLSIRCTVSQTLDIMHYILSIIYLIITIRVAGREICWLPIGCVVSVLDFWISADPAEWKHMPIMTTRQRKVAG